MKLEYKNLNGLLKCFISDEVYQGSIEKNNNILIELAQKHQVLPIAHYVMKKSGNALSDSKTVYLAQVSNNVKRKKAEEIFSNALCGIPFIYYKGSSVAELYPVPQLRTMGDVDVLIHQEDRERVHELLIQNGFVFTYKDEVENGVWHYNKGNIEFEVHTFVLHPDDLNDKHKAFFDDAWKYVDEAGQLDWNFHFLILIAHIREHLIKSGIGIRPFLDVAIVSKKVNLDWQWIRSKADEIGLIDFLVTVVSLNQRWFGVQAPLTVERNEDFYEESLDYIMRNGIFGFDNSDNDNIQLSKIAVLQGKCISGTKILNLVKLAFPPNETMVRLPYCSYIKAHKWLLPVAWIHRFFYKILDKKHRENFVSKALVIDQGAKNKIELLHQWGL